MPCSTCEEEWEAWGLVTRLSLGVPSDGQKMELGLEPGSQGRAQTPQGESPGGAEAKPSMHGLWSQCGGMELRQTPDEGSHSVSETPGEARGHVDPRASEAEQVMAVAGSGSCDGGREVDSALDTLRWRMEPSREA